jgi:ABC-type polysaccharide/polyol phosphate export permease
MEKYRTVVRDLARLHCTLVESGIIYYPQTLTSGISEVQFFTSTISSKEEQFVYIIQIIYHMPFREEQFFK